MRDVLQWDWETSRRAQSELAALDDGSSEPLELGRAVDVTGMHISNIEKGKSLPSPELITKLAEALEANVDEMLHLADQIDPEVAGVIQSNPYSAPSLLDQKDRAEKWIDRLNNHIPLFHQRCNHR